MNPFTALKNLSPFHFTSLFYSLILSTLHFTSLYFLLPSLPLTGFQSPPLWPSFSTLHKFVSWPPLFCLLCIYHLHIQLCVIGYTIMLISVNCNFPYHIFYYKTEQQWCLATDLFQTISNFRELCHLC